MSGAIPSLFPISDVISKIPAIRIVDAGAMSLGEDKDPYSRLNRSARPGCTYLPHALGDGTEQILYECNAPMTSSLLEPNEALLAMFHGIPELTRVVRKHRLRTVRLDDVPQAKGTDYLKLDVQGAELMVLGGALAMLRDVLVVHTEVEFLPMYKNQPLFADIDAFLRGQGFVLHRIAGTKGASHRIPGIEVELSGTVNQMIWGEAVYARDFMALDRLSRAALLKLAAILHENYGSHDLAAVVLHAHDRVAGTDLFDHYLQRLFEDAPAA